MQACSVKQITKRSVIMWQLLVALFYLLSLTGGDEYYVFSPSNPQDCPTGLPCHNLSFYTDNSELYFVNNTIFYFLEGTHTLEQDELLMISDVSNLTLTAQDESFVSITCLESVGGGLAFFMSNDITISKLHFYSCGGKVPGILLEMLEDFAMTKFSVLLFGYTSHTFLFIAVTNLTIYDISVQNGTGYGLAAVNTFDVQLSYSSFNYNNIATYTNPRCSSTDTSKIKTCFGGNAYFLYIDPRDCLPVNETYYYLNISHSSFNYGVNKVDFYTNAGLGIGMFQSASFGIDVTIDSVTTIGNTASYGANFVFDVANTALYHSLTINNLTSTHANGSEGAGFLYDHWIVINVLCTNNTIKKLSRTPLAITNSEFSHNVASYGAGAYITSTGYIQSDGCAFKDIKMENNVFKNNTGDVGTGLILQQYRSLQLEGDVHFSLKDIIIKANTNLTHDQDFVYSAVLIFSGENVTFNNVSISDNNMMSGLHIHNSVVSITGTSNTTVSNNTAVKGGGIYIQGSTSEIIFKPPTNLVLSDNVAEFGGGLFVDIAFGHLMTEPLCFFQIDNNDITTHIYSINNTATVTGDILYSSTGTLFECKLFNSYFFQNCNSSCVFNQLIVNDDNTNKLKRISSSPVRACFCDGNGRPNCTELIRTIDVIPGINVPISANIAAVGLENGLTPGKLKSNITYNDHQLESNCTNWKTKIRRFVINEIQNISEGIKISLTIDNSLTPSQNIPLTVHVNLLPCPPGFTISSGICDCNEYLASFRDPITCNPITQTIKRIGNNWIKYDTTENCTIIYEDCPFDYCNHFSISFNITRPNPQCAHNRTGTLCGQCAKGLSLILGSNQCRQCSNEYLALLVAFATAGIVLAVFLLILNLTVSVGTVNGLIFYANVVKINEQAFFPNGPSSIPHLSQFIAWINLDLGIKTCFYNGLNAYAKTWLQFVFPFYVFILLVIIIIAAKRSGKFARLVGTDIIKVLVTLFVLSYNKILRTVMSAMQMATIKCDNIVQSHVWLVDGSVEYWDIKHTILFAFSLFVFLFIALPYTILHIFLPVLEKKLNHGHRWYFTFKFYYDANCAPFREDYAFWSGVLLSIRLVLVVLIPFFSSKINTSIILGTIVMIMLITWNLPKEAGIYQQKYLDIIESWFLLNLAFMCLMSLNDLSELGTIISTSLAFITFLVIIVFHIWMRVSQCLHRRVYQNLKKVGTSKYPSVINKIKSYLWDRTDLNTTANERIELEDEGPLNNDDRNSDVFRDKIVYHDSNVYLEFT